MKGMNSVRLRGYLAWPKPGMTAKGFPSFKAKIAVPVVYSSGGEQRETKVYHNICAWGNTAEALGEMFEGTPVEIEGTLNSRSYTSSCPDCGSEVKKYWTEVQVNNVIIVNE